MKYGNLHLHSYYSDGVLSPLELCSNAKKMGYKAISITDHNTVSAHKSFCKAAADTGMDYILGMEANGVDGYNFHIVGYDFDITDSKMSEYLQYHSDIMYRITKLKFDELKRKGDIPHISWQTVLDDAPENAWLCNEHIFASLVKREGYTQKEYREFFLKFKNAKPENLPKINYCTPKEIIRIIRNSGGIASLAHPHKITKFLKEFYSYGLNCVEYDHPDITEEDILEATRFAKEHKMYLSGGTDHTGQLSNFPYEREKDPNDRDACFLVPLTTDVRNGVTEEEFYNLKNRIYG